MYINHLCLDKLADKAESLQTLREEYNHKCEVIEKQTEELKQKDQQLQNKEVEYNESIQEYKGKQTMIILSIL